MKLNFELILALNFVSAVAWGGGGWVGNGPVNVAYEPLNLNAYTFLNGDEQSAKPFNSLLLPEGKNRISFGADIYNDHSYTFLPIIGYSLGLTENWTLLNLTSLGYSLKSGNGVGHEVALTFGLSQLGYGSLEGFVVTPAVSLIHTWRAEDSDWRFTDALTLSGTYQSTPVGDTPYRWSTAWLGLRLGVSRQLGDAWAVEFSAETLAGQAVDTDRTWFFKPLVFNPEFDISRKLGEHAKVDLELSHNILGNSGPAPLPGNNVDLIFTMEW